MLKVFVIMASRGRGRGRGRGSSFAAEALGLGRGGESIPPPTAQPPPLFPPLDFSPAPLPLSEGDEYMFLLKQEFRGYMKDSPYHIKSLNKKKDIQRYSDKYQVGSGDNGIGWQPDWKRFPKELQIKAKKARPPRTSGIKPSLSAARKPSNKEDVLKKLEELEQKESGTKSGEEEEEEEEGEGEEEDNDFYDEEEQEEGTDYISNYFDPGEEYLDEDDGLDDGPTY